MRRITDCDVIKACVREPVYAGGVVEEIGKSGMKEVVKLFYKVWSGFTKYIKG